MREKKDSPKILTSDEEQKLLDWTHLNRSFRDYLVILTVLRMGLRASELRELLVSDICDGKEIVSVLEVRPEIVHDRQRRTISLPHDLREQLEAFINWKRQQGESIEPMSFLFVSAKSPQITVRHLQRIVRESTIGALGVPYRIQDLRLVIQTHRQKDAETAFLDVPLSGMESCSTSADHADSTESDIETVPIKRGVWRTYDVTDGLAGNVTCMLQDSDGYLWIGAYTGLCRYDGTEFITYTTDDGLAHNCIHAIYEDNQSRLWFGTPGGVSCYNEGMFVTYTMADGLVNNDVMAICQDSQGLLWFGTQGGISCFDGRNFTTYATDDGLTDNSVRQIHKDRQGRLWFADAPLWYVDQPQREAGWGVVCFDERHLITYTTKDGLASDDVWAMCEDRQGHIWFGTSLGASCYDGEEFVTYTDADGLANNNVRSICEDRQGRLWLGTTDGVSCFDGRTFQTYTAADGLAANHVEAIYEDFRGHLWFSFRVQSAHGVSCFDGHTFRNYTVEDGLLDNRARVMLQDGEGHLWFSHLLSGLSRFDSETLEVLTPQPVGLSLIEDQQKGFWFGDGRTLYHLKAQQLRQKRFNVEVYRILEDSQGNLWIGTQGDGLYCYDSPHIVWCNEGRRFTTSDGLDSNIVSALLETRDGTIWVGTSGNPACLCRFDATAFEAMPTPHVAFWHLFEDSRGRIWMSDWSGSGISCYDGKNLTTYTTEDGLPSNHGKSFLEDDSGDLWIGTWEGLCRFDGKRFVTYGRAEGLESLHHQSAAKDAAGHLWFATLGGGIYRTDGKHFQWLTEADGLPSNNITGLVPQPDGSMIIGTTSGIVRYRPTALKPRSIEIREVVADRVYPQPSTLVLRATESERQTVPQLAISYHGLSLATRQIRYSYVLEGYDQALEKLEQNKAGGNQALENLEQNEESAGWQDTWERQVRYENLPVGEYTFKVIAINRDLIPSEAPATVKITVVPDERDAKIASLQTAVHQLQREVGSKYQFESIIGRSVAIEQVYALMERAIDSGLNVLISGETGTGKELVAKAIHYNSSRKDQSLLDLNCGGLPKELIAAHLFGHRKGTFTGAIEDRAGLFELAEGGTVILDEIGEMPLEAQPNLLRALQEHKVQRIGEYTSRDVDVRLIVITSRDLLKEVEDGGFREDLYYRLSEFPIHIPPLRERSEDIPLLADHFYEEYCREREKELGGFAPDVFEMLSSYPWPGNVRELRNEIRRACALVEDGMCVQTYHFSPQITRGESLIQEVLSEQFSLPAAEDCFQRRMIEDALRQCDGNRTQAAKMLGINRRSLYERMRRLDIRIPSRWTRS